MLRRLILIYGTVEKVSALVHSPPLEGWQAYAFCNVCV